MIVYKATNKIDGKVYIGLTQIEEWIKENLTEIIGKLDIKGDI